MTRRDVRGHDPPPPLRRARARVHATGSRWPTWTSTSCRGCSAGASCARPGLVRFRRADYLGDPAVPLAEAVRDSSRATGGARRPGPAADAPAHVRPRLQPGRPSTTASTPAASSTRVVAEVTNTPWGERHAYVLPPAPARRARATPTRRSTSRRSWAWTSATTVRATAPGETLSVHIESRERRPSARSTRRSNLRRRPLTAARWPRSPLATRRDAAHARADLRPRASRSKLKARPAPPPPAYGGLVMIERVARGSSCALLRAHRVRPADPRRGRRRAVFGSGSPAGDRRRALDPRVWPRARARRQGPGRGLRRRALGLARPDRGDRGRRAQPATAIDAVRRRLTPRARAAGSAPARCSRRNTPRRARARHRRALRPRQRPVRADARRDDDVLGRDLRAPRHDAGGGVARPSSTASATSSTSGRATTCSRSAPAGAASRCTPRATRGCRVTTTTISREQHDARRRSACARPASRTA